MMLVFVVLCLCLIETLHRVSNFNKKQIRADSNKAHNFGWFCSMYIHTHIKTTSVVGWVSCHNKYFIYIHQRSKTPFKYFTNLANNICIVNENLTNIFDLFTEHVVIINIKITQSFYIIYVWYLFHGYTYLSFKFKV